MTSPKPPRVFVIGGQRIEVHRVVEVDVAKRMLHIDELPDGKLRLTMSRGWGVDVLSLSEPEPGK